jgi:hypothetical protein
MSGTKLVAALTAGLLAASLAPAGGAPLKPVQEEAGTVVLPTPHPQDPQGCFQGVARRINMVTQGLYTGPVTGAIFDIDEASWNGKFKLTRTTGEAGSEDIDIFFFQTFGDITQDPAMNSPVILAEFRERNTEGEAGVVPPTSTKAIVCLWSGVAADWEYIAHAPKKGKKKR